MRKWMISFGLLVGLALILINAPEPALTQPVKPIILKYADTGAADVTRCRAAKDTMFEIEKKTGGKVKHEFYWSESLMKAKDILEGTRVGTADVGVSPAMIYHPAIFPLWQLSNLMFIGGPDLWGATKAWQEMATTNPLLKAELEKTEVKHLGFYGYPTTIFTKKPVEKLEDLKGMRIRSVGAAAKWFSSVGATAVPMTFYEVTEALARGAVDGTIGYIYAHYSWKFHTYCKYLTLTPIAHTCIINTYMNLNTWKKLSPDVQKIYEEEWLTLYPKLFVKYTDDELAMQLKAFKDAGVKFIELTPAEYTRWRNSAGFILDDYSAQMAKIGVDGKKIIEEFEKLYAKYERKK